jgi:DNA processing protein
VAIVGTRRATEYGRRTAARLAAELAGAGVRVVSGLAAGIDAESHRGALEAGGETVGVLGCGIGHVYPASSQLLYEEMEHRGLLLSEFAPGSQPRRDHFPRRNRIIAGLSDAVVVVQAGERSGALITVEHASQIGIEVCAVPGPVDLPASAGVHALLRDGAALVESGADVADALGWLLPARERRSSPVPVERRFAAVLGDTTARRLIEVRRRLEEGPASADELVRASGLPVAEALSVLGRLGAAGALRELPGARFELAP